MRHPELLKTSQNPSLAVRRYGSTVGMNLAKKLFESRQTRLCSLVFKIVTRVLLVGSINSCPHHRVI